MSFRILIILLILFAIDLYVFQGVKILMQNRSVSAQRTVSLIYWGVAAFCLSVIVIGNIYDWHDWNKAFRTYSFAFIVTIYFSKLFVVLFLLLDDVLRLFLLTGRFISHTFFSSVKS